MNLRKKKRDVVVENIEITSLLDVLVILLVFLLQNFNDTELSVDLIEQMNIPNSISETMPKNYIVVQVNSKKDVYINNKNLGNLSVLQTKNKIKKILELEFEKFKEKKNEDFQVINFMFDKTLSYYEIDQILDISNNIGFLKYKLIVQGDT